MCMSNTTRTQVDRPTLYRIAADADADPRSVAAALRGKEIRGRAGERIRAALRAHGIEPDQGAEHAGR